MSLRDDCDALLVAAYDATNGNLRGWFSMWTLGDQLGWGKDRTQRATMRLHDKGYFGGGASGGMCQLTIHGVEAVEQVRPDPAKQRDRAAFLSRSYEMSDANPLAIINLWDVGTALAWERDRTSSTFEWLREQGFAEAQTMGGGFSITEAAVDIWEEATANPESPTAYFPPIGSLQITGPIQGSNILSPGASATYIAIGDTAEVAQAIEEIRRAISEADLADGDRQAALRDVDSLEEECKKAERNPTILKACWDGIRRRAPGVIENLAKISAAVGAIAKLVEALG